MSSSLPIPSFGCRKWKSTRCNHAGKSEFTEGICNGWKNFSKVFTKLYQSKRSSPRVREALIKSARGFGERFWHQFCVENRRNTLCISRFSKAKMGSKDPPKPADDLFRVSLEKDYFLKLSEEVGELAKAIRKDLTRKSNTSVIGTIDEEIWDVIYYAVALANCYDIDLERVIAEKEAFNRIKYSSDILFETDR